MPALQKITTTYSEHEDRLCLSGELAAGGTQVLWLTQRMTNRLVQALTGWLESEGGGALAAMPTDLRQSWMQEVALRNREPAAPVRAAPDAPSLRPVSVDLSRNGNGYVIAFRDRIEAQEEADLPTLTLSSVQLRQWLAIVRTLYATAGWPPECWPTWLETGPAASRPAACLH